MSTKNVEKTRSYCDICEKVIVGNTFKFKSHLYQHKIIKPRFQCSYCQREFFRNDQYIKHMNKHTGISNQKTYTCDHCDRSFVDKRNLLVHLQLHDDYNFVRYKCMACAASYCEERLLKYHIRKAHFNLNTKESTHVKKELNETWYEGVKGSKVCVQMTKINDNIVTIKKIGTVKDNGGKMQESKNDKSHFKEYITSVFASKDKSQYSKAMCDYCKKEMLKKSLLSHIREKHLKLRRFKCNECKSTFMRHYQLVDHVCGKFKERKRNK